jgi:hypothetical protein
MPSTNSFQPFYDNVNHHSTFHEPIQRGTHRRAVGEGQRNRIYADHNAGRSIDVGRNLPLYGLSDASTEDRYIRGLPRRKSVYRSTSGSIPILPRKEHAPQAALNPMQRWQDSPPEDEPASISAILDAISRPSLDSGEPELRPGGINTTQGRSSSLPAYYETSSAGNWESANSSCSASSVDSTWSAWSSASQIGRPTKRGTGISKRKKSTRVQQRRTNRKDSYLFPCTFCCDTFKSKYDWMRHEKSLHFNLEKWICSPSGAIMTCALTGDQHCAFCSAPNPSSTHLDTHNYRICHEKSPESRVFYRKDHLRQHLRHIHRVDSPPHIDTWKFEQPPVTCRCGFCGDSLDNWQERANHLVKHFRDGKRMTDWRGSHGFDPTIEAQIMNAMPPYLIGTESASMVPFSATNHEVRDHLTQIRSRAAWPDTNISDSTFDNATVAPDNPMERSTLQGTIEYDPKMSYAALLAFHLGRYAQQQMSAGIIPSDEMFQQESRRLLYGCDDSWNQTIADSPEWLEFFKRERGLLNPSLNSPDAR